MKKLYIITFSFIISICLLSCDSFKDAFDTEKVKPLTVSVNASIDVEGISNFDGLKISFDNYDEDIHETRILSGEKVSIDGILPGIYSITISGKAKNTQDIEYYLSGSAINQALYEGNSNIDISIKGLKISPLLFKEIYWSCSKNQSNKSYPYDQFYEIYNNSSNTMYLDGLYFADIQPLNTTTTLPTWPESDGGNYVYGRIVWKIPGTGTDYPLAPGESCILAEFAVNHKLEIWNPKSPVDCSTAEFEFHIGTIYPNTNAPDMQIVFYQGKASTGTLKMYLSGNQGGAYVIFKVPEGEHWDPIGDKNMQTPDLAKPTGAVYAKIPISYVLDAVEGGLNETKITQKRMPTVLDAGMTYVGAGYNSQSVSRKLLTDEDGNVIYNEDGSIILQDTNNSTDDFDRNMVPTFRRYNTKMPVWNHTLK